MENDFFNDALFNDEEYIREHDEYWSSERAYLDYYYDMYLWKNVIGC